MSAPRPSAGAASASVRVVGGHEVRVRAGWTKLEPKIFADVWEAQPCG
jgi:hypothetical protein